MNNSEISENWKLMCNQDYTPFLSILLERNGCKMSLFDVEFTKVKLARLRAFSSLLPLFPLFLVFLCTRALIVLAPSMFLHITWSDTLVFSRASVSFALRCHRVLSVLSVRFLWLSYYAVYLSKLYALMSCVHMLLTQCFLLVAKAAVPVLLSLYLFVWIYCFRVSFTIVRL